MQQIRVGVFETNSSSTHSLTIVSEEDYEKWVAGEYVLNTDSEELQSIEDAKKSLIAERKRWDKDFVATTEEVEDMLADETKTYDVWCDSDKESFIQRHTTKSGDKIVAFGLCGYDG